LEWRKEDERDPLRKATLPKRPEIDGDDENELGVSTTDESVSVV
jgi:hypothetical protein